MKKFVGLLFVAVVLSGASLLQGYTSAINSKFVEPTYASVRASFRAHREEILADGAFLRTQLPELVRPVVTGVDAGPSLNRALLWEGAFTPAIDPIADARARDDLFKSIRNADYWDVDANRPFAEPADIDAFSRALPELRPLRALAHSRLEDGGAGRADVEQLARLCMTTESIQLVVTGLRLLKELHPEKVADYDRMLRMSIAQGAWVKPPLMSYDTADFVMVNDLAPSRCAGLNSSIGWSIAMRDLLEEDYPEEYRAIDTILSRTALECRLVWVRAAWLNHRGGLPKGPRSLCFGQARTGLCRLPDATFSIPVVRRPAANLIAVLSLPNLFAKYESKPDQPAPVTDD